MAPQITKTKNVKTTLFISFLQGSVNYDYNMEGVLASKAGLASFSTDQRSDFSDTANLL